MKMLIMMNVVSWFSDWWAVLVMVLLIITAILVKLVSLWRGNVLQWLIDICAEAEKVLGGGTGYLKLRYVYDIFVSRFTVISKLVPFDLFAKLVDTALEQLNSKLNTNVKIKDYISGNGVSNV